MPATYKIKQTKTSTISQPIVLQDANGPCALLAIVNILILKDTPMAACINSHLHNHKVDEDVLLTKIGEIASNMDIEILEKLFTILPTLSTGLLINPKFNGEFDSSAFIFDKLKIKLMHGWVLGLNEVNELIGEPKSEIVNEFNKYSYDEFAELQFSSKVPLILELFVEKYRNQLTPTGYDLLVDNLNEDELAVLFWNNHFSTIIRHNNAIYMLITDEGVGGGYVWESVDLKGAGVFVDGNFNELKIQ